MAVSAGFENKLTTMNAFIRFNLDRMLWSGFNLGANTQSSRPSFKNLQLAFFAILLGSTLTNGYAQTARFFSTDNKLSSTLINQVFEDNKGFIWVATEDGLNRLDGAKVEKFNHQAEDSTSILHNYVRDMYQLSDHTLLIGYFNGLQRYEYATQRFHEIPMYGFNGKLMQPHVTTMVERYNGEILIGTSGSGIFRLVKGEDGQYVGKLQEVIYSEFIQKIFEDRQNRLWVMTQDNGLYCKSSDSNPYATHYLYENESESNLSSIVQAENGNIYIGKLNEGLFRFVSPDIGFEKIPYTTCHLAIKDLYVVDSERIYVGTENNGMKVFNPKTETFADLSLGINKFDFGKSKVHSIMMDSSENLWLGIYQKGIALIPFKPNNFKYIGYQSINKNTIGSNSITALQKERDSSGVMWVGTDGDGIYKLDSDHNLIKHYLTKESTSIMCLYEDSEGGVWTGTYLSGLGSYQKQSDNFKFDNAILDSRGNTVDRIYALTEDANKNLWIGSMGSGLFSLDLKSGEVVERNIGAPLGSTYNPEDYMQNNWINTLLYTPDNKLYIGTYNGLSCLDLNTNSFIFEDGLNHVLGHKIVYALHQDHSGNIWIGTSEGLYYKPKDSWELQNFSTDDGLPSNVVCAIVELENGNLWLSTHRGISKFNTQDESFTNFYFNDGLQGNEFNKGAVTVDNAYSVYFGGINGVSYFDPNQITEQGMVPEIRMTALYIDNKQINATTRSNGRPIVESGILVADTLSLGSSDNTFTMEFAPKNFMDPQRLTYYYAVDDSPWVNLQQGTNTIRFTDMVPDHYTIRVKAKELGAFSDVKTLTVIVRPPWYGTLAAKIAYVVLFFGIGWVVISQLRQRHRISEKVRAQHYENQIKEAKIQFFTNISHEIKTPISLILNPLKKLMSSDEDQDRQNVYGIMHRNSERILHLINQLMEMRKIDQGQIHLTHRRVDMVGFIEDICFLFEDQKSTKNISLSFHSKVNQLNVIIDPSYFDKTLLNLLSNAFKFTPEGGSIVIVLEPFTSNTGVESFRIGVKDNGIGVAEHDLSKIFDRFYRSNKVELHPKEGTGIGLHLTRSIVNLHKGQIYAINNTDQTGCTMIMELPIDCESAIQPKQKLVNQISTMDVPVTQPEVAIEKEIEQVSTGQAADSDSYKGRGKSRILVIDDDVEIRNYLSSELSEDYHVMVASNGKLGYTMILNQTPDLIISDVSMPEMDGVSLCRKIKKNINVNHIPVILLTARSREQDNLIGLDIGADAYLAKPFNLAILKTTVKNIINNREMLKNSYSGKQMPEGQLPPIQMKSADEKLMERVTKYINDNLDNPELNVAKIAKEIGISRVHLYRKLKELTNQSTRDFVRNIRLKQAADLLASKNLSVTEVTYATGFSHVSKFSSSFKEFYGCSPKEYKSIHLKTSQPQDYMDSMAS